MDPKDYYLNDTLINAYLELIRHDTEYNDVLVLSTYFYTLVKDSLRRKEEIPEKKMRSYLPLPNTRLVLIPVNIEKEHWCFVALEIKEPKCAYLVDSYQKTRTVAALEEYLGVLKKVLNVYYKLDVDQIDKVAVGSQNQLNAYDCGLFMCEGILRAVRYGVGSCDATKWGLRNSCMMRKDFYCRLLTGDLKCINSLAL